MTDVPVTPPSARPRRLLVPIVWEALLLIGAVAAVAVVFLADHQPVGKWAGWRAGVGAVAGLTGSGLVAGLAGVVYALRLHAAPPISSGSSLALVALAVALLGGVSVFGRRGGVAGVLLATVVIGSVQQILAVNAVESWIVFLVTGIALLTGLLASRATESLAGPN